MDTLQIRVLLKHYWKQNVNATQAVQKICDVEGEDFVSIRVAQKWFKKFNEGREDLQDKRRPGRPITTDFGSIRNAVEANPSTSTRRLSDELGIPKTSVLRHLHSMDKVNRCCRQIPHDLTESQMKLRMETCQKLIANPFDHRFIRRIVTSDEKWVYLDNPNRHNQWLNRRQLSEQVPKRERFSKKLLLCVWWNFEGVIHFEVLENNVVIDADLYCVQLDRMYMKLKEKYPALVNRKRILLQHDNAKPHTARKTKEKINELDAFELLPHPAYSPDLAPSDYHLFRSMAHFLRGRRFNNLDDVEKGCQDFFSSKDKDWYQSGIQQLVDRWIKTINSNGLYFET